MKAVLISINPLWCELIGNIHDMNDNPELLEVQE